MEAEGFPSHRKREPKTRQKKPVNLHIKSRVLWSFSAFRRKSSRDLGPFQMGMGFGDSSSSSSSTRTSSLVQEIIELTTSQERIEFHKSVLRTASTTRTGTRDGTLSRSGRASLFLSPLLPRDSGMQKSVFRSDLPFDLWAYELVNSGHPCLSLFSEGAPALDRDKVARP